MLISVQEEKRLKPVKPEVVLMVTHAKRKGQERQACSTEKEKEEEIGT
jgi:hypothetical protein